MKWLAAAQRYLDRLGKAEYEDFLKAGGRQGKFSPSEYMNELVGFLGAGDERGFKSMKMQRGPFSSLGI